VKFNGTGTTLSISGILFVLVLGAFAYSDTKEDAEQHKLDVAALQRQHDSDICRIEKRFDKIDKQLEKITDMLLQHERRTRRGE